MEPGRSLDLSRAAVACAACWARSRLNLTRLILTSLVFRWHAGLLGALLLMPLTAATSAETEVQREYLREVTPESPSGREARHRLVAARIAGPIVLVRGGAAAFAPSHSLEACVAAMDYGADGVLVDVRRTHDGVLVIVGEEMLDRITDGFGSVESANYRELLSLRARRAFGRTLWTTPPTLAALLEVARQRAMLLHLNLPDPGVVAEVGHLIDAAEAWELVVGISPAAAAGALAGPAFRPLRYKSVTLPVARLDVDPSAVSQALSRPGQMILVDDPRVAARTLNREPFHPRPYTVVTRVARVPVLAGETTLLAPTRPLEVMSVLATRFGQADPQKLVTLLESDTDRPNGDSDFWRSQGDWTTILERAWAATGLGHAGDRRGRTLAALERQARAPTACARPGFDALDGLAAVRALGELQAGGVLARLAEQAGIAAPSGLVRNGGMNKVFGDGRFLAALLGAWADAPSRPARRFLRWYVEAPEAATRPWGPARYEEATLALMRQRIDWNEIAELLRSSNPAVRGTAILECLDHFTEERGLALRTAALWAAALPAEKRRAR